MSITRLRQRRIVDSPLGTFFIAFACGVFLSCCFDASAQTTSDGTVRRAGTPPSGDSSTQEETPSAAPVPPVWTSQSHAWPHANPFTIPPKAPQSVPVFPKAPQSVPSGQPQSGSPQAHSQSFPGSDQFVGSRSGGTHVGAKGDISLDFTDADIHDVVRSVLGDTLQLPFAIDPQVAGRITLKTGEGIAKADVLAALESALKLSGFAIVQNSGTYNVVPLADAQKPNGRITLNPDRSGQPGYGIEIIPLRFVSAENLQKVLTPLVPTGGIVSIDPERNLVFLAGTEPERAGMRQTIDLFDVDYLKSMSFSILQPTHVDAETLATELDKVFQGTENPISGLVRLIPISRINSLLVVSSRASYLDEVNNWVSRLDIPPVEPGRRLYYYRLQNARASDVAQTLSQLFGGAAPLPSAAAGSSAGRPQLPQSTLAGSTGSIMPVAASMNAGPSMPAALPVAPAPLSPFMPTQQSDGTGPQIVTDEANNALIIRANQADYAAIERMLHEMDVAPDQVLIEATIAEVTLNDELKYGIEWAFQAAGSTSYTLSATGVVSQSFPGVAFSYLVPNAQIAVSALGTLTHVTVLSSPKILTLDNKAASLQVGDQVPLVSQSAVSVNDANAPLVSTVEMRDTGVILNITPRISKSGMVFLDVAQEVSDVIPTTSSQINSPTIEERRIQATVGIKDGQTVALGGLIQRTKTNSDTGVPYLKDIPFVGNLFRTVDKSNSRSELIVFLTPHVIRDPSAAQAMTTDLMKGLGNVKDALDEQKAEQKAKEEE